MVKEVVVGVDIGGTFTKYGLVDKEGNLFLENSIETDVYENAEDFISAFKDHLAHNIQASGEMFEIKGVGIGAPNGNYYSGCIEDAPNLRWKGVVPLAEMIHNTLGVPAILTNDANAAALGEMIFGGAKGMKNFLMITLGTGLGSGLVVNGDLVYGHDGFAGELGHVNVVPKGRKCGCGKRGCLEAYVSATGLRRTIFDLLATETSESCFWEYSYNDLDPKQVTIAAEAGDPIALKAFQKTGKWLGRSLADTVAHISPEAIFFFGGLARAGDWVLRPTKAAMEENLLDIFKGKVKLLPSALHGKNIAVLGASALMWKEMK
ncbi:ROK family protein [Bacteroidota bacterium]